MEVIMIVSLSLSFFFWSVCLSVSACVFHMTLAFTFLYNKCNSYVWMQNGEETLWMLCMLIYTKHISFSDGCKNCHNFYTTAEAKNRQMHFFVFLFLLSLSIILWERATEQTKTTLWAKVKKIERTKRNKEIERVIWWMATFRLDKRSSTTCFFCPIRSFLFLSLALPFPLNIWLVFDFLCMCFRCFYLFINFLYICMWMLKLIQQNSA